MKLLQKCIYKKHKCIITGILENGNIAITMPYRINNVLYGYIRKEVNPATIELL